MTLRRPDELVAAGLLPPERLAALERVAERYAVAVTPQVAGLVETPDDPIGDDAFSPVEGIVHRYPDRVLLKPHHACAVYCRYCFRRERVGPGGEALDAAALARALDYIRVNPAIWEVILTGGDPLLLSPRRLASLVGELDGIAHLGSIRVHTRLPVVDPDRVTPALVAALSAQKALWVVLHVNHARELTPPVRAACERLSGAGIPLLSQSVLLRGVNDDSATLEALFRALVSARIKPYYLHHPDPAPGTARFRLPIAEGQALMRRLRGRVSGLCQPEYVLDIPGGFGKVPIGPAYLEGNTVEDPCGRKHLLNATVENSTACDTSVPASTAPTNAATAATRCRR